MQAKIYLQGIYTPKSNVCVALSVPLCEVILFSQFSLIYFTPGYLLYILGYPPSQDSRNPTRMTLEKHV